MTPSARPNLRFGLFIGQVGLSWAELVERFRLADSLGFDHAWLVDHLMPTEPPYDRPIFEAWSALAGLAAVTERIRIGVLVTSNTFRNPAVLAKAAATVDHISRGRLIFGIGTGWHEEEHRRFGIPMPPAADRVRHLNEALDVIESVWSGDASSHRGPAYRLEGALGLPRPMQSPRIPILIAAHRPRMLALAARRADVWDTFATLPGTATAGVGSELRERIERFEAAARAAGRDPATIRRSTWVGGEALRTSEAYEAFAGRHIALGFTDLITGLPHPDGWDTLRRVATSIIPQLREDEEASPAGVPAGVRAS